MVTLPGWPCSKVRPRTAFGGGSCSSAISAAVVSRRLLERGCIATIPLQPSAQDEEEPRIFPWALLEQAGQGGCADQALGLRDLRHG